MRNLKRALSLLLSSTMVLGMLVMGGSAAGYKDVDDSNVNQEAIEVLQTVGIMTGDQNGNFNPDGSITRNEMAVVMAHLLNLDYDYYRGTNPFTDVPEWAAPYVAACAAEGVVAGIGNGQFGGNQKVTAAQASLMIMKALGYFQNAEDFGTDWQVATIRQASYINLFNNISSNAESALTRAQVAQLVLNGLKANMVDFTGDKGIQIGDVTVGYKAEYTAKTNAAAKYNSIVGGTTDIASNNQYYVQLGEELYNGDLKLSNDGTDVFGRPSRVWEYKGDEVGTYAKKELIRETYTSGIEGGDVYTDIGAAACDYDLTYWVDGIKLDKDATADEAEKLVRNNDDPMASTGNGVLTEVYVDTAAEETTIVVINTYLAQAVADYSKATEKLTVRIYNAYGSSITRTLSNDDFDVAKYSKDDVMLVTMAGSTPAVKSVSDPKVVSNIAISTYSVDKDTAANGKYKLSSVTTDGTKYSTAVKAFWDSDFLYNYNTNTQQLKDYTYNLYLDPYGYVVGLQNVEDTANYMFIAGYDVGSSVLAKTLDKALVIFPDGKMQTVTCYEKDGVADVVNADKADVNAWYSYTVDKDGNYVINGRVANQFHDLSVSRVLDTQNPTLKGTAVAGDSDVIAYGNTESVYITATADKSVDKTNGSIIDVTNVTTGIRNTSIDLSETDCYVISDNTENTVDRNNVKRGAYGAYVLYDGNYVKYAVVLGEDSSVGSRFVYLTDGIAERSWAEDPGYYWSYDAIVNGELLTTENGQGGFNTLVEKDTQSPAKWLQGGSLYKASYDADGYAKKMELMKDNWQNATTDDNKDNGYVQITNATTGFDATLRAQTIYFKTANWDNRYVMTDDNCVFYVQNTDTSSGSEYVRYDDIDAAMAATGAVTGETYHITGRLVAICDKNTGFATTVIISDSVFENKNNNPGGGATNGDVTYVLQIVNKDTFEVLETRTHVSKDVPNGTYNVNNGHSQSFSTLAPKFNDWGIVNASDYGVIKDNASVVVNGADVTLTYRVYLK